MRITSAAPIRSPGENMRHLRASLLALIGFAAGFAALALPATPASAQGSWPTRPVRFIIPLGPGSGVDITARLVADKLAAKWGQPVVVENRPGGDAIIAITAVISAADDHVLLFAPASTFTAHPLLHEKLPYKPDDLVPIARVTNTLIALGVPTELGVASVKELAAKIKAAPGKLNYASVTGANDLLFAAFLKTEKLEMAKVPYKDPVTAINDLAEGRIQAFVGAYAIMRPRVLQGKVKVIALTNAQHAAALNDIPTAAEDGFKSLELDGLVGVLGPKAVAPAVRDKIATDIRAIVNDPDINTKLVATGQVVNPGSPAEFAAALKDQSDKVADIGKILGIKAAQ
jgi:tripartite-type tricarboxylate transporter receptor subunit TctC